jgi:hypothetical protein
MYQHFLNKSGVEGITIEPLFPVLLTLSKISTLKVDADQLSGIVY